MCIKLMEIVKGIGYNLHCIWIASGPWHGIPQHIYLTRFEWMLSNCLKFFLICYSCVQNSWWLCLFVSQFCCRSKSYLNYRIGLALWVLQGQLLHLIVIPKYIQILLTKANKNSHWMEPITFKLMHYLLAKDAKES